MMIKYYLKHFYKAFKTKFSLEKRPVKHFGDFNPEHTIYIIKRDDSRVGLFSNVIVFLGYLKYGIKKKYIPVIDMMNYPNAYLKETEIGVLNSWEFFLTYYSS